jgi:hypothetical protein
MSVVAIRLHDGLPAEHPSEWFAWGSCCAAQREQHAFVLHWGNSKKNDQNFCPVASGRPRAGRKLLIRPLLTIAVVSLGSRH